MTEKSPGRVYREDSTMQPICDYCWKSAVTTVWNWEAHQKHELTFTYEEAFHGAGKLHTEHWCEDHAISYGSILAAAYIRAKYYEAMDKLYPRL